MKVHAKKTHIVIWFHLIGFFTIIFTGCTPRSHLGDAPVSTASPQIVLPSATWTSKPLPTEIKRTAITTKIVITLDAFTITPDLTPTLMIEQIVKSSKPERIEESLSPDGRLQVERIMYSCMQVASDDPSQYAYEILQVVRLSDKLTIRLIDQFQTCGGVGTFGLGSITWSPSSRYYYFTDAREGTGDGGMPGWQSTVYRFDAQSQQTTTLGPSLFSPSLDKLVTIQLSEAGELGLIPRAIQTMDIEGNIIDSFTIDNGSSGTIRTAWSSDEKNLVYLEYRCPPREFCESYLYLIDPQHKRTMLLSSKKPAFMSVDWQDAGNITLIDEGFRKWRYSLLDGKLEMLNE